MDNGPIPDDAQSSPLDAPWLRPDCTWYRPSWSETARLLSWRWVYCLPLILMVLLLVLVPRVGINLLFYGWKLIIFAIAIPIVAFASSARHVIQNRKDPFCIHCGYSLTGLPDGHRCPECGEPFLFRVIEEYRRDPDFFVQRIKSAATHPVDQIPFSAGPVHSRKSRDGT